MIDFRRCCVCFVIYKVVVSVIWWMRTIEGRVVILYGYFSNFSLINQIDTWCEWISWEWKGNKWEKNILVLG
jgi:hypothetical protein